MNRYEIKGNYYNNNFHKLNENQINNCSHIIQRECPADIKNILWRFPINYKDIENIIVSVNKGFNTWKKIPIKERINTLKRYQENILSIRKKLEEAISLENGKPLWEAKTEVDSTINKVDITIEYGLPRIKNKEYKDIMIDTNGFLRFKPIGPCLIISPFNFPCHLANTQILNTLISGNSIILKPSEKTAYSAQLMIECLDKSGFPDGVINLIQGDGEIARRLIKEKSIKGIFFTGSKEVGIEIQKICSGSLTKLLSLELGGKNTAIVDNNINLKFAVPELIKGSFLSSGQRCTSTSIIIVHEKIIDKFIEDFHDISKKIIIDHPIKHKATPFMGPLIDKKSLERYLIFMGMAKREGLKEIMRGKFLKKERDGYYVSPSIHLCKEFNKKSIFLNSEIFGPNCTLIPYKTKEEAIKIANSTEYGLSNCVFTNDRKFFEEALVEIDTGILNLNKPGTNASPILPFGGVKNSGNYRPASIATIDACVYQISGLDNTSKNPLKEIIGIKKF